MHRWKNFGDGDTYAFATTTTLGSALVLRRPEVKDLALRSLLDDCQHYNIQLFGFVVMSNHWHMLLKTPDDKTVSWVIQRLKSNSARILMPSLTPEEQSELGTSSGLNQRSFWQKSFRGFPVPSEEIFLQKLNYIHQNPVKAGLVSSAELYRWSSDRFYQLDLLCADGSLDIDRISPEFGLKN